MDDKNYMHDCDDKDYSISCQPSAKLTIGYHIYDRSAAADEPAMIVPPLKGRIKFLGGILKSAT